MTNNKQQTAVEWLLVFIEPSLTAQQKEFFSIVIEKAKEMEKQQSYYTKSDVIKAGEMGEINYLDTLHIVTYLDEAKQFNETYGGNK
jgi:hypothetical protein